MPAHKRAARRPMPGKRAAAKGMATRLTLAPIETPEMRPRSRGWRSLARNHAISAEIVRVKVQTSTIGSCSSVSGTLRETMILKFRKLLNKSLEIEGNCVPVERLKDYRW